MIRRPATFLGLAALLLPVWLYGQGAGNGKKDPAGGKPAAELPPVSSVRYENGNHRDPFLNPLLLQKQSELKATDEEAPRGNAPPGIAGMYIAQIMLVGVSSSDEKRTAIFRGTDKRAYFLQAGDRVFDGYVKQVNLEEAVIVRETRFRSGKVTTQEVTKRLRTP